MILYRYVIQKNGNEYNTETSQADTEKDEQAASLAAHFDFSKLNRLDFPEDNKIIYLFNNELVFAAFTEGIAFRSGVDVIFASLQLELEEAKADASLPRLPDDMCSVIQENLMETKDEQK